MQPTLDSSENAYSHERIVYGASGFENAPANVSADLFWSATIKADTPCRSRSPGVCSSD